MLIIGYNLNLSDRLHSLVIKDVSYKMYIPGLGIGSWGAKDQRQYQAKVVG